MTPVTVLTYQSLSVWDLTADDEDEQDDPFAALAETRRAALRGEPGAVLLALSTFNPAAFSVARAAVAEATTPVATAGGAVVRTIASVPEAIGTWWRVHGENAELRERLARARGALLVGRQARLENVRLRALLRVRDKRQDTVTVARIVSTSASSTRRASPTSAATVNGPSAADGACPRCWYHATSFSSASSSARSRR